MNNQIQQIFKDLFGMYQWIKQVDTGIGGYQ
jgi:hypothetical protein